VVRRLSLLAVGAALVGVPSAGALPPTTGNASAIAFYRQSLASYRSVPAVQISERGVFWYEVLPGGAFRYTIYEPRADPGERPATVSSLWLLHDGTVREVVWQAKAAGLPRIVIIETAAGMWAGLAARPAYCYYRQKLNLHRVGHPLFYVAGHFAPLRRSGSVVTVTSTYPLLGRRATEVDRIAASTKQFLSARIVVSGSPAYTDSESLHSLARTPRLVPAPAPHC